MRTAVAMVLSVLLVTFVLQLQSSQGLGQAGNQKQQASTTKQSGQQGDMEKHMRQMNDMMVEHLGKRDPDFERRFIDMMIPHHEGAIRMARQALEQSNQPELRKKAEEMIKMQEKEIEQLKQWRKEWYGTTSRK